MLIELIPCLLDYSVPIEAYSVPCLLTKKHIERTKKDPMIDSLNKRPVRKNEPDHLENCAGATINLYVYALRNYIQFYAIRLHIFGKNNMFTQLATFVRSKQLIFRYTFVNLGNYYTVTQ